MALAITDELPAPRAGDPSRIKVRTWQKVVLLAAFAWALVVVVPDFSRLYWNLGSFGFSADNDGLIYQVSSGSAASRAGLTTQDKIDLKSGPCRHLASDACRDFLAVFGGMGGLAYVKPGTSVNLPMVGRANVSMTADTPKSVEPATVSILLLDEIAAVFVLWRAFKLVWTRFSAMTVGFFLYVMWFNPGQYFTFYAWLQGHPKWLLTQEVCQALAQGAGYAGFLIFALRFPKGETEPQFRGIERLAVLLGAALAILQLLSFANVFGYPTETITRCAMIGGYVVAFYGWYIVWRRRKLQAPADYQRMRWVLWGCLIGLPAFVFADSNEATSLWTRYVWSWRIWNGWSPSEALLETFFLISGIFAIFICEAIRRQRIVNVSFELRRLAATGFVLLLFAAAETWIHDPISHNLATVGISGAMQFPTLVAAALVCSVGCHKGMDVADHLMNGRLYDEIVKLNELGVTTKGARKTEAVDAVLANDVPKVFHLASAAVFRNIGGTFQAVCSHPAPCSPPDILLLEKLEAGRAVRLRLRPSISRAGDAALAAPTLAVPVMTAGKLEAAVLYGPHETGDDIDPLEVDALEKFAQQAAVGYETARLASLQDEVNSLRRQLAAISPRPG